VTDIKRIETGARMSRAVIHNGVAYLAGTTAAEKTPDIRAQTRDVLQRIEKRLAEVGSDKSRLLTAQIWIKDIKKDFAGMNEVWDAWTVPGNAPTRATAECNLAAPEILVEIIVTAAV
jgi:enamine deaminase RidA (YjgF/YER057c/UK114 family)